MVRLEYQVHSTELKDSQVVYILGGIGSFCAGNWQQTCTDITKVLNANKINFAYIVDDGATAQIKVNREDYNFAKKVLKKK